MKTGTMVLFVGAGVVVGSAGLVLWGRAKKGGKSGRGGKKGQGGKKSQGGKKGNGKAKQGKGKSGPAPRRTTPVSMRMQRPRPPATREVFVLSAADAKAMTCDLRRAKNVRDVEGVLDVLLRKIEDSGASMVDLRSSGLTRAKIPVAQFESEAAAIVREIRMLPPFMWGAARSKIDATLSSLPACDAPMQQWQAMFGGVDGVQAAVRPPPFTLLQGLRPLRG